MTRLRSGRSRAAALAALLILPLLAGGAARAQAPQPPARDITVQNETEQALRALYVMPRNAAERGPDRLGAEMVAPGRSQRVRLGRMRDCVFDVVAVFLDGSEERRGAADLCRAPRLVFGDPSLPRLDIAIVNGAGVTLRELYAVPSAGAASGAPTPSEWGRDRLGSAVIEPGATFTLLLRSGDCRFALLAVYADDREERREADLCALRSLTFDRSAMPRGPVRSLLLANRHLATVQQAYLSPSTEPDWGPDRLGQHTLGIGADTTIETEGGCEADLRIVFVNGAAEERRSLDICQIRRVVLRPGWTVAERLQEDTPVPDPAAAPTPGALRLRNGGPLPIVEIYTAPPGGDRGEDRLGEDTLPIGMVIELDPVEPDACVVELIAVFRDGREVSRRDVSLCAGEEMDIR